MAWSPFSNCSFFLNVAYVQFEFAKKVVSFCVQLLVKCGFYTRNYGTSNQARIETLWILISWLANFCDICPDRRTLPVLHHQECPIRLGKCSRIRNSRRSRPSVSKVISQRRSLGGRCPVDRAAGAALRFINLAHVRVYSRATHDDFFSAFFDSIGRRLAFASFPFFFNHFDWQKLFLNQKKAM